MSNTPHKDHCFAAGKSQKSQEIAGHITAYVATGDHIHLTLLSNVYHA